MKNNNTFCMMNMCMCMMPCSKDRRIMFFDVSSF